MCSHCFQPTFTLALISTCTQHLDSKQAVRQSCVKVKHGQEECFCPPKDQETQTLQFPVPCTLQRPFRLHRSVHNRPQEWCRAQVSNGVFVINVRSNHQLGLMRPAEWRVSPGPWWRNADLTGLLTQLEQASRHDSVSDVHCASSTPSLHRKCLWNTGRKMATVQTQLRSPE